MRPREIYYLLFIYLLDFIYRGSLFSIFTTLIYHKVLINHKTEQVTEQDKQTNGINNRLEASSVFMKLYSVCHFHHVHVQIITL